MKKCSYCGAEYPDYEVRCAIDQTPFDGTEIVFPVAEASKPRIPMRLSLVALLFLLAGISGLVWCGYRALEGEPFLIILFLAILNVLASIGLWRCSRYWRLYALLYLWLNTLAGCFGCIEAYRHLAYSYAAPDLGGGILGDVMGSILGCGLLVWCIYVLLRSDIRELFYCDR